MADEKDFKQKGGNGAWLLTKEKLLIGVGIGIIAWVMIVQPLLKQDFHYEWLILAAACFGVSVAQWGDKR